MQFQWSYHLCTILLLPIGFVFVGFRHGGEIVNMLWQVEHFPYVQPWNAEQRRLEKPVFVEFIGHEENGIAGERKNSVKDKCDNYTANYPANETKIRRLQAAPASHSPEFCEQPTTSVYNFSRAAATVLRKGLDVAAVAETISCATGYEGRVVVSICGTRGGEYHLSGCRAVARPHALAATRPRVPAAAVSRIPARAGATARAAATSHAPAAAKSTAPAAPKSAVPVGAAAIAPAAPKSHVTAALRSGAQAINIPWNEFPWDASWQLWDSHHRPNGGRKRFRDAHGGFWWEQADGLYRPEPKEHGETNRKNLRG